MCGVVGVVSVHDTAPQAAVLISREQVNRGDSGWGIVYRQGPGEEPILHKDLGSLTYAIPQVLPKLGKSNIASGHTWYGTSGSGTSIRNVQPFVFETQFGFLSLSHNGNIQSAFEVKQRLLKERSFFQSSSDSEIILHLIARSKEDTLKEAIRDALGQLGPSYTIVITSDEGLYAVRDPTGNRRLFMYETSDATYIASEDAAFGQARDRSRVTDIGPGEMVFVPRNDPSRPVRTQLLPVSKTLGLCAFECGYFGRPDTSMPNKSAHAQFRYACGELLAKKFDQSLVNNPVIAGVLNSGGDSADGFANVFPGARSMRAIIKNEHSASGPIGRGFILPSERDRARHAEQKFLVIDQMIKGEDTILVDDSIVRGTTIENLLEIVRAAKPKSLHVVSAMPKVLDTCPLGISIRSKRELVGPGRTDEQIARHLKVNSMLYITRPELRQELARFGIPEPCMGCFGGCYATIT